MQAYINSVNRSKLHDYEISCTISGYRFCGDQILLSTVCTSSRTNIKPLHHNMKNLQSDWSNFDHQKV